MKGLKVRVAIEEAKEVLREGCLEHKVFTRVDIKDELLEGVNFKEETNNSEDKNKKIKRMSTILKQQLDRFNIVYYTVFDHNRVLLLVLM